MNKEIRRKVILLSSAILPLVILVIMIYLFLFGAFYVPATNVPIEKIDIERIVLRPGEIILYVINSGANEVSIAQVIVNGALWGALVEPSNVLPRLGRAVITIPYAWVEGEPVEVELITSTGFKFSKSIDVSITSPEPTLEQFIFFGLIGVYVGVIPVSLGLGWRPFLNSLGNKWMGFLLSLTIGLLVFLGIDALKEAFEIGARVPEPFRGEVLVVLTFLLTILGITVFSERIIGRGAALNMLALSYMISLGIGLHNMGEGLAIGAAYSVGEVALGALLIIGFTIHNTTEGIAIVSPLSGRHVRPWHFAFMGLLAGGPTVPGTWIGGFIPSDFWSAIFLAIGAGAIFQVVYAILDYLAKERGIIKVLSDLNNLAGLSLGILIMYVTALLVAA